MRHIKKIEVDAAITPDGIDVFVNRKRFPIRYPLRIWQRYNKRLKEILKENVAVSSTFFIPQMLNMKEIYYKTSRPIAETFLFKNGLYDMATSAHTDNASSVDYLKRFVNAVSIFASNQIKIPSLIRIKAPHHNRKKVVIPFTFGKETLLTLAIAKELGLTPCLVYFVEPTHLYESFHKKKMAKQFQAETGMSVNMVSYGPGLIRYGRVWRINTELGWGLQTTEYALLSLPFVHGEKAEYIALGNEQSCKEEVSVDTEGLLTYSEAYDQYIDWTPQQSLLTTLLSGRKVHVVSFVEPLFGIAEMAILHGRYPELAKFQMSCLANDKKAKYNRWCQNCDKCAFVYTYCAALQINPRSLGFTENIFDANHAHLFKGFFSRNGDYYRDIEIGFAFYLSLKNGWNEFTLNKFGKEMMTQFKKNKEKYLMDLFSVQSASNLPAEFRREIIAIFETELRDIRARLKKLL